jgi:Family of unknown function (DUF6064)
MSEWWSYTLEDFLLFSPRTYWRLVVLHNEAVWPLQILTLLLGAAVLVLVVQPRPWSHRAISAILAAAWLWIAWAFLWNRYSQINWAMAYAAPAFVLEALVLGWTGTLRGHLRFVASTSLARMAGFLLLSYAVILHPFVAKLGGRGFGAAEIVGIAPDPTVIATLGLLTMASGNVAAWLCLVVPLAWCLVSWATLYTMGAPEAWIPVLAGALAIGVHLRSALCGNAPRLS